MEPLQEKIKTLFDLVLGENSWTLQEANMKVDYSEKLFMGRWQLKKGTTLVSDFSISPLPGCCGVAVSHSAHVFEPFRKKGLGAILNGLRIDIARQEGYTVLICTDVDTNVAQQHILQGNGWRKIHSFRNKRTNNPVSLHVINL